MFCRLTNGDVFGHSAFEISPSALHPEKLLGPMGPARAAAGPPRRPPPAPLGMEVNGGCRGERVPTEPLGRSPGPFSHLEVGSSTAPGAQGVPPKRPKAAEGPRDPFSSGPLLVRTPLPFPRGPFPFLRPKGPAPFPSGHLFLMVTATPRGKRGEVDRPERPMLGGLLADPRRPLRRWKGQEGRGAGGGGGKRAWEEAQSTGAQEQEEERQEAGRRREA